MKVNLTSGEVRVGVSHIQSEDGRRGTKVWLYREDPTASHPPISEEAVALCSPQDNFCKKVGRRLAANRLLARLQHYPTEVFSKEDRRKLFFCVCPEYSGKAKVRG